MAAVAVAEGIGRFSGLRPVIKWPNDILLKGRKVAGLLNEIHSETDRIHFVILGVGVNLNMNERLFAREIRNVATSLKMETGKSVSRKEFVLCLLEALEKWYDLFLREGGKPVLEAWRERAQITGKPVKVTSFGETWVGRAVDVDSEGRLILETEKGERKRIVAGDVEYKKGLNDQ
jgi:BirA family biotin operon repressor/biotin-[acetyl-CoA-carboxylase] ligase